MWWEALYLALSAALGIAAFIEGVDEPFAERVIDAALIAVFGIPLLISVAIMVACDWIADRIKGMRQ